jgi:hypothetical protein
MKEIPQCRFMHSPVTVLKLDSYKTETRRKREFQQNWALAPSYIRWNSLLISSLYSCRFFATRRVDDTPTSPNQKEANWAIIQPLLAIFKEQLMQNPKVFAEMLEYSPLPAKLVEMIKNFVNEAENDPQKKSETDMAKKLIVAAQVAKINKDQSTAEMQDAKAGATQATASYDLAMAQHLLSQGEFDKLKSHLEVMKTAADARKADADAQTSRAKAKTAHLDTHAKLIDALSGHQASQVDNAVKIGQLHLRSHRAKAQGL